MISWLIALLALVAAIPLVMWLGATLGRKVARAYPGAAGALWLLMSFIKVDPPPPPRAERVVKDEDAAGDPPTT